ncbi:hypothetical protein [Pseudoruegeria sp. HB172150]|uniref:hypothetical protein n=1 Tax=Pseudoruegeria sp. HB172150 TaxID=2721164 RepID=UPI0015580AAE|nr:hypothetical protein [Pseudoruegeria sp. HB172150]
MTGKTLAERECHQNRWQFRKVFRYQYTITERGVSGPRGWTSLVLGGWRLSHCPDLPVTKLILSGGKTVGLLLGYAISPEGRMLGARYRLPASPNDADCLTQVETQIAELAGRYVVLLAQGKGARIYPDPTASLGPVYNPQERRAAASTLLALTDDLTDNPEVPADEVAAGRTRYLFGHTADARVRRAAPNHYLDLADFTEHRHWPGPDTSFDPGERNHKHLAREIGAKLQSNMLALTGRHACAMGVTGGTDSRLLLATMRNDLGRIRDYFVYQTNWSNTFDLTAAEEIAEVTGIPLQTISRDDAAFRTAFSGDRFDTVLAQRRLRGGCEPSSADAESIRAMQQISDNRLILRGNVAEMTRAIRWSRAVMSNPHDTAHALAALFVLPDSSGPHYAFWQDRFETWKAALPDATIPRIYDILHAELWVPHANSAQYIREHRHFLINPFNDRRLIHLTAMVEPPVRKNRRLVKRIIRDYAPDLRSIDYKDDRIRAQRKQKAERAKAA